MKGKENKKDSNLKDKNLEREDGSKNVQNEEVEEKPKKKKSFRDYISVFIIVIGLGIIGYPYLSQAYNNFKVERSIKEFQNSGKKKDNAFKKKMEEYNKKINTSKFNTVAGDIFDEDASEDAKASEMDSEYVYDKTGDEEMLGVIHLPAIDMKAPIYYGSNASVLQKGIGILENTSYPGGDSTHSILTGHRGTHNGELFKYLDEVVLMDDFYIDLQDEVLKYTVYDIKIVEPWEVSNLELIEGKDLATLLTCDPYLINTHRLLVMGERAEITQEEIDMIRGKKEDVAKKLTFMEKLERFIKRHWRELAYLLVVLLILLIVLLIRLVKKSVRTKNIRDGRNENDLMKSNGEKKEEDDSEEKEK